MTNCRVQGWTAEFSEGRRLKLRVCVCAFITENVQSVAMKWSASIAVDALLEVPPALAAVSPQTRIVFLPEHWKVM